LRADQEAERKRAEEERQKESDRLAMSLEQARSRSIARRPARRGTIATSPLGIPNAATTDPNTGKTLLGQ
jgi:hypothetical protein